MKIDRSFAKGAGSGHKPAPIVHAINQLAHALGMEVVAEGVETPEELMVFRAAGCDSVQGYYIGRPWDVTSVAEVLARYNETPSENPLLAGQVKLLQA